jgi:hypothetical protein
MKSQKQLLFDTILLAFKCDGDAQSYSGRTVKLLSNNYMARTYFSHGLEKGSKQTNTQQRISSDARPSLLNEGLLAACYGRYGM